jgi:hypothetical protein
VFDRDGKVCHRGGVRRLIALLLMVAFVAATAAPALAACRMGTAERECCCPPPPANSICPPDCCDAVKAARPVAHLSMQGRTLYVLLQPALAVGAFDIFTRTAMVPGDRSLVALHERAAPRLPLRI